MAVINYLSYSWTSSVAGSTCVISLILGSIFGIALQYLQRPPYEQVPAHEIAAPEAIAPPTQHGLTPNVRDIEDEGSNGISRLVNHNPR